MTKVSVIIPCRNEEKTIEYLLNALVEQTYPIDDIEVVIADGVSTDGTRQVIEDFKQSQPELNILVIDNNKKNIPSGLNRALETSTGDVIIRLDAHSIPSETYVEQCVEGLNKKLGENVGGMWVIKPSNTSLVSKGIAIAAAHPIGAGNAQYRVGAVAQEVDTVPFGAYHRQTLINLKGFDETLLSNEDYELNVRIRKSGGRIWFDPTIWSEYFSRPTFKELAKQYWRYGYWKFQMLRKYPDTLRVRQLAGLFVLSWLLLGVGWIINSVFGYLFIAESILYLVLLLFGGIHTAANNKSISLIFTVPIAFATMHFSWGFGFLWSILGTVLKRNIK